MLFRIIAIITLVFASFSCSKKQEEEGAGYKKSLEAVLNDSDQLTVITPYVTGKDLRGREGVTSAMITGKENIQELLSLIEFKAEDERAGCNCKGSYILKFSKKGRVKASIGYQHLYALRWTGGAWEGDRLLTEESINNILKWFTKHGFNRPAITYKQKLKERKIRAERFAILLKHFDKKRHVILEQLNGEEHPTDPQVASLEAMSKQLYDSYEDKTQLLDDAVHVFGSSESARGYDYYEQIIIKTVALVNEETFARYLREKKQWTADEKSGVCCFLLFQHRLNEPLYQQQKELITKLIRFWLEREDDYEFAVIGMNTIFQLGIPELNKMYEPYANGEKSFQLKRRGRSKAPDIAIRYLILLKSAEDGDRSMLSYCDALLKRKNSKVEQSILNIAKALLNGDLSEISEKDFAYRISLLSRSRYLLAKRHPSQKSYDILVAGTKHPFTNVRAQSVLDMEKITGKKWFQNKKNDRVEWHGKDVRAWWAENRATYKFPKSKKPVEKRQ